MAVKVRVQIEIDEEITIDATDLDSSSIYDWLVDHVGDYIDLTDYMDYDIEG